MDSHRTFHLLGETLTFMSPMELKRVAADWIELDPGQVISQLRRDTIALGAAWRALESIHGYQMGPPSERTIVDQLHKKLVDRTAHLIVARAATEHDGLRCGIGRVRNKHAPTETVELEGINHPGNQKIITLEKHTAEAYARLTTHARAAGFEAPLFLIVSGYRNDARQAQLFAAALVRYHTLAEARKWVAPPGHSAHATGCAIDFWFGFKCGKRYNDNIKSSDSYKWMVSNAKAHGFNAYEREGWHWEYNVGLPY
ncbi:MAG TPA: M15 family metallopeptidase [Polyangia bacterium]|jgi:hypothetical protein|nr:M15 family metallopeptidase [Polyangia bacterium]